jgi:hypothetical protein
MKPGSFMMKGILGGAPMAQMMTRLRNALRSLGNDGAVANVSSVMARAAADRHAVDQLGLRLARATPARAAPAA